MIGGIALQVGKFSSQVRNRGHFTHLVFPAMMTIFVALVVEYLFRYLKDRPVKKERERLAGAPSKRFSLDTRCQTLLCAGTMGITTFLLFVWYAAVLTTN